MPQLDTVCKGTSPSRALFAVRRSPPGRFAESLPERRGCSGLRPASDPCGSIARKSSSANRRHSPILVTLERCAAEQVIHRRSAAQPLSTPRFGASERFRGLLCQVPKPSDFRGEQIRRRGRPGTAPPGGSYLPFAECGVLKYRSKGISRLAAAVPPPRSTCSPGSEGRLRPQPQTAPAPATAARVPLGSRPEEACAPHI